MRIPPVSRPASRKGFTLLELLTVIVIIAVLVALTFPIYGKIAAARNKVGCASNLRQIGAGVMAYAGENDGYFPPCSSFPPATPIPNAPWNLAIARYVGAPTDASPSMLFKCPADIRPYNVSGTNYARSYSFASTPNFASANSLANVGLMQTQSAGNNIFPSRRMVEVTAPQDTLMIAEWWSNSAGAVRDNFQKGYNFSVIDSGWALEADVPKDPKTKKYYHGDTMNVLFVDGHVGSVTPKQIINTWATNRVSLFTAVRTVNQ
jgi:prepilin-type N-terminal cleavage/methylation domain-containing protein/prepilin-type processing-associated H-X9-DG protein